MKPLYRFAVAAASAAALAACQQDPSAPDAAPSADYALEVQKLKTGPSEDLDAGLAALDARFGFTAPQAMPKTGSAQAGYSWTGKVTSLSKGIFHASAGDRIILQAQSLNVVNLGISDPVALLIQFDNAAFIQNGTIPKTGMLPIKILARNDDVASGNLTARIDYTFKAGESGYFMWLVHPLSNLSAPRKTSLSLDIFWKACPQCDVAIVNPVRVLGGMLHRPVAGISDFRAERTTAAGDPRIYALKFSSLSGSSNGDVTGLTTSSQVSPFPYSAEEAVKIGNHVVVDNEVGGADGGIFNYTEK